MTPAKTQLISDARNNGWRVNESEGVVYITKYSNRRLPPGLAIYANGTAYRTDVMLEVATTIRNVNQMRQILNLA